MGIFEKGKITKPPTQDIYLVPQKAYSSTGTLADQVTYPEKVENPSEEQLERMKEAMKVAGLEYLMEREKWRETIRSWEGTLSLGEQQRMGLARLFFHKPKFAILDEW